MNPTWNSSYPCPVWIGLSKQGFPSVRTRTTLIWTITSLMSLKTDRYFFNFTKKFRILLSNCYCFQIMLIVNHDPILSNLYTSTRITPYEVQFSLSLERVMFYNPNVTWHNSWLSATAGDKPFADVYKIDGLRGIYIASQIIDSANPSTLRSIHPKDLRSLITFDQGAIWTPVQGPKTDEDGRNFTDCVNIQDYKCNLHLSQQLSMKYPSTRSIPILSSESAIGIVIGSGNMGANLKTKSNVFVSADAGLSWHQVLKGSYFFNMGDHGGILVATKYYKLEGPTNILRYSTDEGITWNDLKFYKDKLKVKSNF